MVDRRQGRVVAVYLLTVMRRWISSWTRHRLDQPAVSERATMHDLPVVYPTLSQLYTVGPRQTAVYYPTGLSIFWS